LGDPTTAHRSIPSSLSRDTPDQGFLPLDDGSVLLHAVYMEKKGKKLLRLVRASLVSAGAFALVAGSAAAMDHRDHAGDVEAKQSPSVESSPSPAQEERETPGLTKKKDGLPPGLAKKRNDLPPGLAKKENLPPGLAKKKNLPPGLAKKKNLPPGLAKKENLPPGLAKKENLPPGLAKKSNG
jgi:hypothetical protein